MHLKTIAVVGPRGNVGSAIIKELLADGRFSVTGVTRATSAYTAPSDRVNVVVADFASLDSLTQAFQGQNAVLSCVTKSFYEPENLIIDAAIAAGVKLYFANEFISDPTTAAFSKFPTQFVGEKPKIREYLISKAEEGKISWTSLNGGPFFDMWLMKGPSGFDIAARKARIYGTGNCPACWTPLPTIARAMANMLRSPDTIANHAVMIAGVRGVTQNALLEALEAETGEKFAIERVDLAPIRTDALAALEKGEWARAARGLAINNNFNEEDSVADFWDRTENERVGVTVVGIREAVNAAMRAYGVN